MAVITKIKINVFITLKIRLVTHDMVPTYKLDIANCLYRRT
jgi:hypothetical protein